MPLTTLPACDVDHRSVSHADSSTDPLDVSKGVTRINVPWRYLRETRAWLIGPTRQKPCFRSPSNAAKQALESKRGQQSHSIEPLRLMSTPVVQSPIKA